MTKYINQLIADFQASADSVAGLMGKRVFPEGAEELEKEVDDAMFVVLQEYINILPEQFPPVHLLNINQVRQIEEGFILLLKAYGFLVYFPPRVHLTLKYQILVKLLSREVPILTSYYWHIATCDYEPKNCPFGGEYCTCF